MSKGSFILYDKDLQGVELLSDYQAGKLFKALTKYRLRGETSTFGNNVAATILFQQLIDHIAINEEKYEGVCKKNSESAKKRWQNKPDIMRAHAQVCERINSDANACVYDNDNDNDNDNVNVNDNDNDNAACGWPKENKRKNNYKSKNTPRLLQDDPNYDIDAFLRKTVGLNYQKKEEPMQ